MSFKKLFFNADESVDNESTNKTSEGKSTTTNIKASHLEGTLTTSSISVDSEHLTKAHEIYQNGFDLLNADGYDFYEFYKAIIEVGDNSPMAFNMAFKLAKAMDKTITKESLLTQADSYIQKINESYVGFVNDGNNKKTSLINEKEKENANLNTEYQRLQKQYNEILTELDKIEAKLKNIDSEFAPKINEIESKLKANDIAKDTLINSINNVKQGLNQNIQ